MANDKINFLGNEFDLGAQASNVKFNNSTNGMQATNVQAAIEELKVAQAAGGDGSDDSGDTQVSALHTLHLGNVDKLLLLGDSYTECIYYIKGKGWVNQFAELVDYSVEAWGQGGITAGGYTKNDVWYDGLYEKMRDDVARFNAMKPSQLGCTRALINVRTNDAGGARPYGAMQQYGNNMEKLSQVLEGMGIKPYYYTQHGHDSLNQVSHHATILNALAKRHKSEFFNTFAAVDWIFTSRPEGYNSSHPTQRTGGIILDQLLDWVYARLPRPASAIKIYRLRTSESDHAVSVADRFTKLQQWQEIALSQSSLTDWTKWDEAGTLASGFGTGYNSEYGALMAGSTLNTNNGYYLLEVILPTNQNNCESVTVTIDGITTASVWDGKAWVDNIDITEDIKQYLVGDKLTLCIQSATISAPTIHWVGATVDKTFVPSMIRREGTEQMSETSAYTIAGNYTLYPENTTQSAKAVAAANVTPNAVMPGNVSGIVELSNGQAFRFLQPGVSNSNGTNPDQTLRIVARWNPPTASSEVTQTSFDRRSIALKGAEGYGVYGLIGRYSLDMSWRLIEVPISYHYESANKNDLQIVAESNDIEIAVVSQLKH